MRRASDLIRVRSMSLSAISAGAASTRWLWGSPPTASTGCSPTGPISCASSATSALVLSIAFRVSSGYSSARRRASSARYRNYCAAKPFSCQPMPGLSGPAMALLSAPVFNAMPGMRRASQSLRNSMAFNYIAVLGAGAWGAALAITCARAGRRVTLWEHDPANAAQLAGKRESLFLPGVALDAGIVIARDLAEPARAQAILLVVPAQAVRGVAQALAPLLAGRTPVVVCAKGIERRSKKFMTEVIAEC